MSRGIEIRRLDPIDLGGVCNIAGCRHPAIRQVRFNISGAVVHAIRLCLAHVRELRDVVDEEIG